MAALVLFVAVSWGRSIRIKAPLSTLCPRDMICSENKKVFG